MNQELSFETMPFELNPEFHGEMFEEESEWGRRGSFGAGRKYSAPRSQAGLRSKGAKRPPISKPRPIPKGRRRPWGVVREPHGFVSGPYPGEPGPSGSERVRWVQDCLNQATGTQLPVTGVMGAETRSAVRSFQQQQGLRATGIAGPDTEEALRAACNGQREFSFEAEPFNAYRNLDGELEVKIMVDEPGWRHINQQLAERFRDPADQEKILSRIRKLIGMPAPPEAVGPYEWYVQVGSLGDGTDYANIVVVGHMIRSILKRGMIVRGVRYVIRNGKLRKAKESELEWGEAEWPGLGEIYGEMGLESPFSEAEEIELAAELLSISSEEELDQFLGKMFKGIGRGLKKAGRFIGKRVLPVLGKGLKALGKVALPIVGKALGSFIPIPGVGTAIGGAVGTALSKALELEVSGLNAEEAELERARRFVRIAGTAMHQAALSSPDIDAEVVVNEAIMSAARKHLPYLHLSESGRFGMLGTARQGQWTRRGDKIVVLGA